jgi:tryptophan 2,3-dioxygenase
MRLQAEEPFQQTGEERRLRWEEYLKIKKSFETITDEANYNAFVAKGERRLSHNALKGALMIYFYRDMPRFSQPYQILFYLMDIDSLLQKWRCMEMD